MKKVVLEKFKNKSIKDITFDEYMYKFIQRVFGTHKIPKEVLEGSKKDETNERN